MKNIILVDISSFALESILSLSDVFIAVLVVDTTRQRDEALKKFPGRIGQVYYRQTATSDEFMELHKNDYAITYDDIEKYKLAQLKVEHYLHRELLDYNKIQYRYLVGLQYWLDAFSKYDINCVISMHQEHGGLYDSIPFEIAKQKNIPIFVQDTILGNYENSCQFFKCINNDQIINLKYATDKFTSPKIENYVHNKETLNMNKRQKFNYSNLKSYWKTSLFRLFLRYLKYQRKSITRSRRYNFYKKTDTFQLWYTMNPKEVFLNTRYIRNLAKTYQKISTDLKDIEDEKYIYYALHFEPEASIMNRASLSNQLYIIKLLSESLPEGWKLYVKEHPSQFELNSTFAYFLKNIFYFRTERFYKAILDNKNVRLISLDVSSEKLLKDSQAAATICGTISLETVVAKKPLILFGEKLTILGKLKDVFGINSKCDIINSIEEIKKGFIPKYEDFEKVLSEYLYEEKSQELFIQPSKKDYLVEIFNYILNYEVL